MTEKKTNITVEMLNALAQQIIDSGEKPDLLIELGETPNCPCHNQPCVWTSYNQALWNEPKQDHYSCAVTKEKVDV